MCVREKVKVGLGSNPLPIFSSLLPCSSLNSAQPLILGAIAPFPWERSEKPSVRHALSHQCRHLRSFLVAAGSKKRLKSSRNPRLIRMNLEVILKEDKPNCSFVTEKIISRLSTKQSLCHLRAPLGFKKRAFSYLEKAQTQVQQVLRNKTEFRSLLGKGRETVIYLLFSREINPNSVKF